MSNIKVWLENLGLGKYADIFAQHEVDFEVLPELTEHDLKDLDISLGPRNKRLQTLNNL